MKMFYFTFSGLSLFTLVIVCVAEPNVEWDSGRVSLETTESREGASLETTETREGKSKCWNSIKVIVWYLDYLIDITTTLFQCNFFLMKQTFCNWFDFEENKKRPANQVFFFSSSTGLPSCQISCKLKGNHFHFLSRNSMLNPSNVIIYRGIPAIFWLF